jgi:hypothetical protein
VFASLGTVAVSILEKQKRWSEASEVLRLLLGGNACVTRRGDWWTRLAINLEHQGLVEQALEVGQCSAWHTSTACLWCNSTPAQLTQVCALVGCSCLPALPCLCTAWHWLACKCQQDKIMALMNF